MTKSTITRERIQRIIRAIDSESYDEEEIREWLTSDEIMELARMALAAMDSEPVTEVCEDYAIRYISSGPAPREGLHPGDKLYRHAQPAPDGEQLAIENFRSAMEGIGHIRRTLEETFGGLHGTHVEPDILAECKAICDAIYAAYSGNSPVIPDGKSVTASSGIPVIPDGYVMVPKEPTAEMQSAGASAIRFDTTAVNKLWTGNTVFRAMLAAAPQEVK
ncbi:hypothetical protein [Klebsiella quasipneumoniae]|uniref:hypothetical protein n=1 Tax=Klebsiella quasipneumoniae TaxID=1463165 RepID=UPI00352B3538